MTRYAFHGADKKGTPIAGEMEAETAVAVIRAGRADGHSYYSVRRVGGVNLFSWEARPLRVEDLNLLTEQLASLTASGVPLAPALKELSRELPGRRLGRILEFVHRDVDGGTSLEEALARRGEAIPPLYSSLVRVGERTGNLPEVLRQLTGFGQRYLWFRYRLQIAMAYPAVLLVLSVLFLGVFVPHVIGNFEELYASFGHELPFVTAGVLVLGRGILYWGLPLVAAIALAVVASRYAARASGYNAPWEQLKMALPVIGPVYQIVLSARFFRAFSLLLGHGAPIGESLHLAGLATGSTVFTQAAHRAALGVAGGEGVSDALIKTGVLRRTHGWILQQGERNGNFATTLGSLADACDREAERLEQRSLSRLGPALVVVCGIFVGVFVVACFIPILQMPGLIGS